MKVLRYLWALVPILSLGILSWLAFGFLAARRRSLPLTFAAAAYLAMFIVMTSPLSRSADGMNDFGGAVLLVLWGLSSFHALWIANGKRSDRGSARMVAAAPVGPVPSVTAGWTPPPAPTGQQGTPDALLAEIQLSASRFNWSPSDRRVDPDIWSGLRKIVVDSWTLLTTARQKGISGDQLIAVEMMYDDYVPSSVRAVTALAPEQLVTTEDAARVNRSAREIVDSISRELTTMMRSVSSGDLSKLDEQRAFLRSRFGQSGSIHL